MSKAIDNTSNYVHDNGKLERSLRILSIGFMGLLVIVVGSLCLYLFKPVESATTPGTCLPIDKGGTGCDGEELRKQYEFIYTTTKQDTGRTTDDGYIIWGQKFVGAMTAVANMQSYVDVTGPLNSQSRLIDAHGSWDYGAGGYTANIGGAYVSITTTWSVTSHVILNPAVSIRFVTLSTYTRTNAPYELFVDWTDGTLR